MGAHVSVPVYRRSLPQRLRLVGMRCANCQEVGFPPTARCRNRCAGSELSEVRLSGRGVVQALTRISAAGAPPEFSTSMGSADGYFVAIVRLEEGPQITAQVLPGAEQPRIGSRVQAVTRLLYEEDGVRRYGFKFALAD